MRKIVDFYKRRFVIILFLTIVVLTCLAWHNRFIQDDAFISFRYAQNLVHGKGLVYNEGERVEGYTNFLWTLMMAVPEYLDFDPVTFSFVLGILFFILSLVFTHRTSFLIFNSRDIGLLTMILLGTNYTFSSYATGGLETQMQACMFVVALYPFLCSIHSNNWKPLALLTCSLLLSAAILSRLDSALLVIVIFPLALFSILKEKITVQQRLVKVLALFLPFTVLVGGWFIWRLSYYGDILPNTFYAKAMNTSPRLGAYYIYILLISYLLIPFPFLFILALKRFLNKSNLKMIAISLVILLWALYVVKVGGDYMEFRFIVPIMPLLFILLVWLIFVFIQKKEVQIALIILVLSGSLHHSLTFGKSTNKKAIATVKALYNFIQYENFSSDKIGIVLGRSFHYDQTITIATVSAGLVPYYSRLKTIDMLGLNDKWVARNGEFIGNFFSGHQRIAPLSYLLERKVNLIIHPRKKRTAHTSPRAFSINDLQGFFWPAYPDLTGIPSDSKMIEIPIDQNFILTVLYLTRNSIIDEAIQRNKWKVYPIVRNQ